MGQKAEEIQHPARIFANKDKETERKDSKLSTSSFVSCAGNQPGQKLYEPVTSEAFDDFPE